jgi:hypothetical protein
MKRVIYQEVRLLAAVWIAGTCACAQAPTPQPAPQGSAATELATPGLLIPVTLKTDDPSVGDTCQLILSRNGSISDSVIKLRQGSQLAHRELPIGEYSLKKLWCSRSRQWTLGSTGNWVLRIVAEKLSPASAR